MSTMFYGQKHADRYSTRAMLASAASRATSKPSPSVGPVEVILAVAIGVAVAALFC